MPHSLDPAAALARAREHVFSMALPDAAADLCAANMAFGLAKIHHALESLGHPPDATFIGTPDMTITRNSGRWRAGVGYGGRLSWGDGSRDLLWLEVKPNTCGMLVGSLRQRPDVRELTFRLHDLHGSNAELDGVPIRWDFGTGNHFIDVYEVAEDSPRRDLDPYVLVMHASGAELRGESAHGPGLYWDESAYWRRLMDSVPTPWGDLHLLRGESVNEYMALYQATEAFAARRRALAAEALFGPHALIANSNHQGLANRNEALLGCQSTRDPEALLPIMVRADRPAFLMQGAPNLSREAMDALGFTERAERLGLVRQLTSADVIPHGAGYSLPHLSRVRRVMDVNGARYFELERLGQTDTQVISDPKDLTWGYRDEAVVHRSVECGLGTIAARLEPLFVLKA